MVPDVNSLALPLALTTPGWTAIGAVGGALVGSVSGAWVEAILVTRRERKLAKAGARLVAGEIAAADSQHETAERDQRYWRFYGHEIESWSGYKDVLAIHLTAEQFEAVSQAVMVLERVRLKMPEAPEFRDNPNLPYVEIKAEIVRPLRVDAAKAYNALAHLSGFDSDGGEVFTRSQPVRDS